VNSVALLRWPEEEERRRELRRAGVPRVLVVEGSADPPVVEDELEDWLRVPADDRDLAARVDAVGRRLRNGTAESPTIDDDGVLRAEGRWVSLPPVEARLTAELVARFGAVVSREALDRAGWPDGARGRNALDVHVLRLRRRLAPVGLAIRTVRSRGYLLEAMSAGTVSE
jgi:DNA-binding response OmpR family regulator